MISDGAESIQGCAGWSGIEKPKRIYWNTSVPVLYEEAVRRAEGRVALHGPFVVMTGKRTGRSPNDKFIVREASTEDSLWWGEINRPIAEEVFKRLLTKVSRYLQDKELFVQDLCAGAATDNRVGVRLITEWAWCAMFARHLFLEPLISSNGTDRIADFTIVHAPGFHASPERDGTNSEAFVLLNFKDNIVLIGGTGYAGEMKKSIFTVMNYLLPARGVLPMHCAANSGPAGDVALFFGLSGTGKTSLSADPERSLIGDDEHGWSDSGVFNFEGGCYAKLIRLSPTAEPQIYQTTRMFGTVLENVVYDERKRALDLDDESITENTRGAYPVSYIPNSSPTGLGGHPRNVLMLAADAFGVLPPIARLTNEQAMYYFLSGYTARLAGTEVGVAQPQAVFSPCFGAPFIPRNPTVYADLLGDRLEAHRPDVWLVNTGWTGGPAGTGHRMPIAQTRALVRAALDGSLTSAEFDADAHFGLQVPRRCPGVDPKLLKPRSTWDDPTAYDAKARQVAAAFAENFAKLTGGSRPELAAAGPRASLKRP